MESTIVLATTKKGKMGLIFECLVWAVILFGATLLLSSYIDSIYAKYDVHSYAEYNRYWSREAVNVNFAWAGNLILYALSAGCLFGALHAFFYGSRAVNTLFLTRGFCTKIVGKTYAFPYSRKTDQVVFDRIINITLRQSSIDRLLNAGTLEIKMVTFTNADAKETVYKIEGINDPYSRKTEIEGHLLDHEGLMVKMR